jgi:aminoglycoside/choline kinase family phosphotransferase
MSELPIPASVADADAAWLTAALRADGALGPDAAVASVTTSQIGEGVGIMGELHRLRLSYTGDAAGAPASVILKLPSPFEANRAQGVALGMYEAEIRFYAEVAKDTRARLPHVIHSRIVPGTAEFCVLMEDLGHMHMADQAAGMSVDQARVALMALADIHASWWGKADDPEVAWIPSVLHERIQMLAGMWPDIWLGFNAKFGALMPEGTVAVGEAISRHYWTIIQRFAQAPWTLIHQDARVENMLFEDDLTGPDPVVVLDWQGLGRGPAAYDIAYLLGGSLRVEDRRAHEIELVRAYHDRLRAGGVEYGFDDLWLDYRIGHLLGGPATACLTGATFDLANERGRALITSMGQRHFQACLDLDCASLIPG